MANEDLIFPQDPPVIPESQLQEDDLESSEYLQQLSSALQQPKPIQNMFSFLGDKIIDAKSNIKSGFLTEEQIGVSRLTSLGHQGIMNFCNMIKDGEDSVEGLLSQFHQRELESMHGSSLSKDAKLHETAMTTKRMEKVVGSRRKKSGWFNKKTTTEDFPISELQP